MSLYLDTSVIMPALILEEASARVRRFLATNVEPAHVSELAAGEVASALSRLVRMDALDRADAELRLSDFDTWRHAGTNALDIDPADVRLGAIFVRRFDLKLHMPNAIHAAICHRLRLTLVTLDERLTEAAAALDLPWLVPR